MHHPTDRITHTTAFVTAIRALAGMRNNSMGPPQGIDPTTHHTMSRCSYHIATFHCYVYQCSVIVNEPVTDLTVNLNTSVTVISAQ